MSALRRRAGVGRTLGALTLGATAGSVLALLLAPGSGQATRRRIGRRVLAWERASARQWRQARRMLARRAGGWREAAVEKVGQTREWLNERAANHNGRRPVRHRVAA